MALTTEVSARVKASLVTSLDLKSARSDLDLTISMLLASGVAIDQADEIWDDERSLATGANEDLDFAGILTNAFGQTVTLVKLKLLIFIAGSTNTTNLTIGPKSSNGLPFLAGTTPTFVLKPKGVFLLFDPSLAGITVTAGTGDLINVLNSAGATATYRVIAVGTKS
jgi:hypothetical protein